MNMRMRLLHGSKKAGISQLEPQYIGGNNGSVDGIGINLTDSIPLARHYAGSEGVVYISDIDTKDYLRISNSDHLTKEQAMSLRRELEPMNRNLRYRLATDLCGKKETVFSSDEQAEKFYKEKRQEYRDMGISLDRLKPDIDFDDNGDMIIKHAQTDFSELSKATTKHIHRCLNLLDNEFASTLLKTISKGLVLPREDGTTNYLSFAMEEGIVSEMNQEFLNKPNADKLINQSMAKFSDRGREVDSFEPSL